MKKTLIALGILASFSASAQIGTPVNDSIEMGSTYLNDVYYHLEDGSKTTQATNNWHLAFRTGAQTDGIRINSATASGANDGSVKLFVYPNGAVADWATFDSTGWDSWLSFDNSDESWEVGAFNRSTGAFPDFGWGTYDMSTHIVTGDSIYMIVYKNAGVEKYKKLYIEKKELGNYTLVIANVDGTDEQTVVLKSSDYSGKNFIYYNAETNTALDREPASDSWDFVLTRYAALQTSGIYYPSTGILTNIGVYAAQAKGVATADLELGDTTLGFGFSSNINAIGYEWKYFEMGGMGVTWHTQDSLAYFIQDRAGRIWKVAFTSFGGSTDGKTVFSKTQITPGTSVRNAVSPIEKTALYPNPANAELNIIVTAKEQASSTLSILNIRGEVVMQQQLDLNAGLSNENLNISALTQGVYFVRVQGDGFQSVQKFIKN